MAGVTNTSGTGLASMRERAEELGGTFIIGDNTPGTVVRATLPINGDQP